MLDRNYNYCRYGKDNYKRQWTYTRGKIYFTKEFETETHAKNYLEVCRKNNKYRFFSRITEQANGMYLLELAKAQYWEE